MRHHLARFVCLGSLFTACYRFLAKITALACHRPVPSCDWDGDYSLCSEIFSFSFSFGLTLRHPFRSVIKTAQSTNLLNSRFFPFHAFLDRFHLTQIMTGDHQMSLPYPNPSLSQMTSVHDAGRSQRSQTGPSLVRNLHNVTGVRQKILMAS